MPAGILFILGIIFVIISALVFFKSRVAGRENNVELFALSVLAVVGVLFCISPFYVEIHGDASTIEEVNEIASVDGNYTSRAGKLNAICIYIPQGDELVEFRPPLGITTLHISDNPRLVKSEVTKTKWGLYNTDIHYDLYLPN